MLARPSCAVGVDRGRGAWSGPPSGPVILYHSHGQGGMFLDLSSLVFLYVRELRPRESKYTRKDLSLTPGSATY